MLKAIFLTGCFVFCVAASPAPSWDDLVHANNICMEHAHFASPGNPEIAYDPGYEECGSIHGLFMKRGVASFDREMKAQHEFVDRVAKQLSQAVE